MAGSFRIQEIEAQARAFWREIDLLRRIEAQNADGEPYFLLDGPPYANNVPHVGHLRTTVYKDLYLRVAMMRGKNVLFQPGFDTHGLPIENMVEKKLGIKSKQDIERGGVDEFRRLCHETAIAYKDDWLAVYDTLGAWYAWKTPYLTLDNAYLESAWWAFGKAWDSGLVYEGRKPVHWCPHCQTALSGYEVTDSYKMLSDPGVYVRCKIVDEQDTYFLVFTTTPWTLPSNVALVVNGNEEYVKAKTKEWGVLILAKERLHILGEWGIPHTILEVMKGDALDGLRYEPLMGLPAQEALKQDPNALRVFLSIPLLKERVASKTAAKKGIKQQDLFEDFVTVADGTGIVHCAPGHGHTDHAVGTHYRMPALSPLDDAARFTDEVGPYAGQEVREASHAIAEDLNKQRKLVHYERVEHSYPVCWRCKTPLVFRLSAQWFFRIESLKEKMLDANEEVVWQPEFARDRMRHWVANASDWNFSRQRYWGIPIPLWRCACGHVRPIRSRGELADASGASIPATADLHAASAYTIPCDACGQTMQRIPDIFDVWFDSGCAPFASYGYPHQNKEAFETHYPVNRISESQDQVRGWFYYLMFVGHIAFGNRPYDAISMPGWVVDEKGDKMSKSAGNFISASDGIAEFGADPLRYYYCWDIAPYELQKFNKTTVKTEVTKLFTILWNLTTLAQDRRGNIDENEDGGPVEDRWLRSRWSTVLRQYLDGLDRFEFHEGCRALYDFIVNDLSRSYVQLTRERADEDTRVGALLNKTLREAIVALAPIAPHVTEMAYRCLRTDEEPESVHLCRLPTPGESNTDLEASFGSLQEALAGVLAARDSARIGVRWPVAEVRVFGDERLVAAVKEHVDLLKTKANARHVTTQTLRLSIDLKPDAAALGKILGTRTGDFLTAFPKRKAEITSAVGRDEKHGWEGFLLSRNEFKITMIAPEGWVVVPCGKGHAAISTERTPELEAEGFAREVARRIQQLRKTAGLEKADRITANVATRDKTVRDAIRGHASFVKDRCGADDLVVGETLGDVECRADEKVKGASFSVGLRRA